MSKPDLRPNSDKSKEAEAVGIKGTDSAALAPTKKNIPKPTLSKGAVKKKPDLLNKAASVFLQGRNLSDVGHYVLVDVLIPKLIDGVASAGKAAIDGIFYGDGAKARSAQSQGNNRYNYSRVSTGGVVARGGTSMSSSSNQMNYHKVRRGFENVTIESRMDAETILDYLRATINEYESVSIADFYEAFNDPSITSQFTDNNWGWFNLDNCTIKHVPGGWQIDLPEPVKLG